MTPLLGYLFPFIYTTDWIVYCTCFIYVLCIYLHIMLLNSIFKPRDVRVFLTVTWQVPLEERELLPVLLNSNSSFVYVRVAQSLFVFNFVTHYLFFWHSMTGLFSFAESDFPFWYFQAFLMDWKNQIDNSPLSAIEMS